MLKKFFIGFIILLLVYVVGGLLMPSEWSIERKGTVQAPRAKVHDAISTLAKWNKWSIWNTNFDPKSEMSYDGPASGKGSKWVWNSEGDLGVGTMEVTDSSPDAIAYTIKMTVPGEFEMTGKLALTDKDGGTEVVWTSEGDMGFMGFMLFRWMNGLGLMDMSGEYDKALAGLAEYVEGGSVKAVDAHLKKTDK
jgi:uncharacterized protein YndB with AHSA1/START domain